MIGRFRTGKYVYIMADGEYNRDMKTRYARVSGVNIVSGGSYVRVIFPNRSEKGYPPSQLELATDEEVKTFELIEL